MQTPAVAITPGTNVDTETSSGELIIQNEQVPLVRWLLENVDSLKYGEIVMKFEQGHCVHQIVSTGSRLRF